MTTLWRIVFLFFLSFFRNKFSLIETSTFSSSLISNETSFIKNSISMKVKIIHTAFIHSFHCVLSFTFPCIIRYRIYFSHRAKRNSFQILRKKNRNLYKFSSPPRTIYLYPSWQQEAADQLRTGRIAAEGIVPSVSAHEKFSRDLNLYARKWKLLRGFDRIYSRKTLC